MVITPRSDGYQWKVVKEWKERKTFALALSGARNQCKEINNNAYGQKEPAETEKCEKREGIIPKQAKAFNYQAENDEDAGDAQFLRDRAFWLSHGFQYFTRLSSETLCTTS